MADNSGGGGVGMGVILGVLLVVVIVLVGFFAFNSGMMNGGGTKKMDVSVSSPNLPKAK